MLRQTTLLFALFFTFQAFAQISISEQTVLNNTIIRTQIPMKDGDSLSATIVINKKTTGPLPAILMYTIYASENDHIKAVLAANMGYAGVVVSTRGKKQSKSPIEPFVHEAADSWDVMEWISKQPWCDGKIGMYGGSYLGFSQWAAAKNLHPALKTIVPQAAVGIGVDFPAHNGVYSVYSLQWLKYVMAGKVTGAGNLSKYWTAVGNWYYRKGTAFNALDSLDNEDQHIFRDWLAHPGYDQYWQQMVPYKEEYARINIPVLTITGYYDSDQAGALFYYKQHLKYNPSAEHYLVMGPYDHYGAQVAQGDKVHNYPISPAAQVNFNKLIFKWFDYVLKGKEKPQELKEKVNWQVMGTNNWLSAPSLQAMAGEKLIFYLDNKKQGKAFTLATEKTDVRSSIAAKTDFSNRSHSSESGLRITESQVLRKKLQDDGGLQFVSEPLADSIIISGSFSGELSFTTNKQDFDIILELYELQPDGTYHDLSYYLARASYIKDRENRQLLVPGVSQKIAFADTFLTSKKLEKGSRLVFILGINKNREWQVNYGSGKDPGAETSADAGEPLTVTWGNDSFISIPVSK